MSEYILTKAKGHNANVVLENTKTKTSLTLGKLTMEILNILEAYGGIVFERDDDADSISLKSSWDLHIPEEVANKLSTTAMPIHKPKRGKTTVEQPKEVIDALDVLFGLASYNNYNNK